MDLGKPAKGERFSFPSKLQFLFIAGKTKISCLLVSSLKYLIVFGVNCLIFLRYYKVFVFSFIEIKHLKL
jgi:hypothetical protein